MATKRFAARLLGWFDQAQRDLPWRRTRDPWAIWVSEIMLQQTRVEAVREPFKRFLHRYPNPSAFAKATDDEVMVAWRGLGYYRRARLLRDGARRVADAHDGVVPEGVAELAALPGIGPYTLGAVASIAFGHGQPAVDGNVERVVSRHRGLDEPIGTARARKPISAQTMRWMDQDRAGDFNQAMMELGATVCTPTSPTCDKCPVHTDCVARRDGRTGELPVKKPPRKAVDVAARAIIATRADSVLGYRIPAGQPNANQIDLPGPGVLKDCDPDDLAAALRDLFGAEVRVAEELASIRHAITHHRITLSVHAAEVQRAGRLRWFALDASTPWTTPARKLFRATFLDSAASKT